MFKIILKNIWSRRKINGWLTAELILVTILAWIMLDPIMVTTYDLNADNGFDEDRLCLLVPAISNDTTLESPSDEQYLRIFDKVKRLPEVENATLVPFTYPEAQGNSSRSYMIDDSSYISNMIMYYAPSYNYFETYGIKSAEGYAPIEELSKMNVTESQLIVTHSFAEKFFPGENAIGKIIFDTDSDQYEIVGVVEDVRPYSINRNPNATFAAWYNGMQYLSSNFSIVLRLNDDIDVTDFVNNFNNNLAEFQDGRTYIANAKTYDEIKHTRNLSAMGEYNLKIILLVFFMINLAIGVIGNFWLQTRQRAGEVAIMKSFGASRSNIIFMLIGEGTVLTIAGCVIGCIIYLQYAITNGLYLGYIENKWDGYIDIVQCWINNFSVHFLIISLTVFILMWIITIIGILIPAVNISKTEPATALHND